MKSYYNLARALVRLNMQSHAAWVRAEHDKGNKIHRAIEKLEALAKARDAAPPGIPWVKLSEREPEE